MSSKIPASPRERHFQAEGNLNEQGTDSKMGKTVNSPFSKALLQGFYSMTVRSHLSHNGVLFSVWKLPFLPAQCEITGACPSLLTETVCRRGVVRFLGKKSTSVVTVLG